jgi:hypothetical protein
LSPPTTGALGTVTATLPANTGTIAELNLAQSWTALQTFSSGLSATTATATTAHITSAALPTFSAGCGSTASATTGSSNNAGEFSLTGTSQTTACTVSFNTPYTNTAFCTVVPSGSGTNTAITYTAQARNGFTINAAGNFASTSKYVYTCFGN